MKVYVMLNKTQENKLASLINFVEEELSFCEYVSTDDSYTDKYGHAICAIHHYIEHNYASDDYMQLETRVYLDEGPFCDYDLSLKIFFTPVSGYDDGDEVIYEGYIKPYWYDLDFSLPIAELRKKIIEIFDNEIPRE